MIRIAILIVSLFATVESRADVIWDEATEGDLLSSFPGSGTLIMLSGGSNQLIGTVGQAAGDPRDIFTFSLSSSQTLESIQLVSFSHTFSSTGFNLYAGPIATPSAQIGFSSLASSTVGTNILPTPPLSGGVFTVNLRESGGLESYQLDLQVSSVPEPSSLVLSCLLATSIATCWLVRFRRRE